METKELEANLNSLDNAVKGLGQSIMSMRNGIAQCEQMANQLESRAQSILSGASSEEDPSRASQMYDQA